MLNEVFVISRTMWSSRKYPYPSPPQQTEGNENSEERAGGGSKRRQFSRGWKWGGLSSLFWGGGEGRGLRVRLMSKQTVILLLIGVPKQTLIFSSMMFYWRSAECFFYGLHDGLCNPIVVGLWLNFQLSVALLHNILWYSMQCVYVLISLLLTRFSLKGSN